MSTAARTDKNRHERTLTRCELSISVLFSVGKLDGRVEFIHGCVENKCLDGNKYMNGIFHFIFYFEMITH